MARRSATLVRSAGIKQLWRLADARESGGAHLDRGQ
jgi:hypothetical protein